MFGNCDTRISLGCTDILTAEYLSNLLGVSTVQNMSIRKDAGADGELQFGQKNLNNIQRNLLNPDEILRLPFNNLIVILRGNKPFLIEKKIYTEHPLAKELKDNPISEYSPKWEKAKKELKQMNEIKENPKPSFKTF